MFFFKYILNPNLTRIFFFGCFRILKVGHIPEELAGNFFLCCKFLFLTLFAHFLKNPKCVLIIYQIFFISVHFNFVTQPSHPHQASVDFKHNSLSLINYNGYYAILLSLSKSNFVIYKLQLLCIFQIDGPSSGVRIEEINKISEPGLRESN